MTPVQQGSVMLEFPNADVGLVLEMYERLTGKHLVRDKSQRPEHGQQDQDR